MINRIPRDGYGHVFLYDLSKYHGRLSEEDKKTYNRIIYFLRGSEPQWYDEHQERLIRRPV